MLFLFLNSQSKMSKWNSGLLLFEIFLFYLVSKSGESLNSFLNFVDRHLCSFISLSNLEGTKEFFANYFLD